MGGDRRSPPHHRIKGGGGGKARITNGGKISNPIGGVISKPSGSSRVFIDNSVLNKALIETASEVEKYQEIENTMCMVNRDMLDQVLNEQNDLQDLNFQETTKLEESALSLDLKDNLEMNLSQIHGDVQNDQNSLQELAILVQNKNRVNNCLVEIQNLDESDLEKKKGLCNSSLVQENADYIEGITFNAHNPMFGMEDNAMHFNLNAETNGFDVVMGEKDICLKNIATEHHIPVLQMEWGYVRPSIQDNSFVADCVLTDEGTDVNMKYSCNDRVIDEQETIKMKNVQDRPSGSEINNQPPNAWKKPSHVQVDWADKGKSTEDGKFVILNMEAVNQNKLKLEKALVGRLIGKKLPFNILRSELKKRWDPYGDFKFLMIGDESFICIFQSAEARDAVLMGGPWLIGGYIIGLDKWNHTFSQKSLSGLTAPVWIRFPNLPLLYWDNDNLARIASMVGQPLWIDAQTSLQGRCAYARVCVRLDLAHKLPTGVWIHGVGGNFFQPVEFEGLHQVCFNCGHIGHKLESCSTKSRVNGVVQGSKDGGPLGSTFRDKSKVGWKAVGHKQDKGSSLELKNVVSSSRFSHALYGGEGFGAGDCSSSGKVDCSEGFAEPGARTDVGIHDVEEEDEVFGPWIFVSRKKGKPGLKRGAVRKAAFDRNASEVSLNRKLLNKFPSTVQQGNKLDGRNANRWNKAALVEDSAFKLNVVEPSGGNISEFSKGNSKNMNAVLENNVEDFGKAIKVNEVQSGGSERPTDLVVADGLQLDNAEVSSGLEIISSPSNLLFSAIRNEDINSEFGMKNARRNRGACRVPSIKEISQLGPIASGSRKKRKGDGVVDDCLGYKEDCIVTGEDLEFGGKEVTTYGGGDASPLIE